MGMNEGTWVKSPPPAELLRFIERTMGRTSRPQRTWNTLFQAGLELTSAKTYRIKAMRQRLDETAGLDAHDWLDRMRAIGSFIRSYPPTV